MSSAAWTRGRVVVGGRKRGRRKRAKVSVESLGGWGTGRERPTHLLADGRADARGEASGRFVKVLQPLAEGRLLRGLARGAVRARLLRTGGGSGLGHDLGALGVGPSWHAVPVLVLDGPRHGGEKPSRVGASSRPALPSEGQGHPAADGVPPRPQVLELHVRLSVLARSCSLAVVLKEELSPGSRSFSSLKIHA